METISITIWLPDSEIIVLLLSVVVALAFAGLVNILQRMAR